ncbi:MICOS complex subunit mic60 [Sphaceloma murrayae]|uniref:MICOS complex subunit mic60 n=1 Tax=Sphaceloma murrayae TaxID=2082308 RepID=A0A2K1QVL5_9PEZI|nr:MICOS complex subunit mic60 [Sphaceloma murrayae]
MPDNNNTSKTPASDRATRAYSVGSYKTPPKKPPIVHHPTTSKNAPKSQDGRATSKSSSKPGKVTTYGYMGGSGK